MFNRKMVLNLVATAAVAVMLAGCGSNPASSDPSLDGTDPNAGYGADPSGGYGTGTATGTSPYGAPTGATGVGTGTSPYGTTTASTAMSDLTATVTTKKNGVFLGMGSYKCTIEVSNPNSVARTGTLTVQFMHGSKNGKTITQQVSLGPNETQDLDFKDSSWFTNGVNATITSDPAQGAASAPTGYGTAGATGAPGAYGAPAGGYGAPTGYGATGTTGY